MRTLMMLSCRKYGIWMGQAVGRLGVNVARCTPAASNFRYLAAAYRSFVKMQRAGYGAPMCANTTHRFKKYQFFSAVFNFKSPLGSLCSYSYQLHCYNSGMKYAIYINWQWSIIRYYIVYSATYESIYIFFI